MGKDCGCGKSKPGPLGNQKPEPSPRSLVASTGGITHVAPDGTRTKVNDLLAGRAAVARRGGSVDLG